MRCGASLFMWGFAVIAFLVGSIQANHLINISFSVLFLIVINPPVLWILRYISRKRQYEYMSMMMNFLEIIGYTAIIYFLGGINALFLSPIYAAVITYVGAIGPNSFPFRIAGMCSVTLSIMVALEYYGFIPHQDPFWRQALPGSSQLIHLSATICMLNVVAFMASYTGSLLKRNKIRLRDQNIELERSRTKLKKAASRLEEQNIELQITANRAQESDRMKSEFLANMSHELRTPLNHIIGFTELVVDKKFGEINDIQEEYLNDVLQSSNFLLELINDILDLSVVEAGRLKLEFSNVNIRKLLKNSLSMVTEKANKHCIKLSFKMGNIVDTLKADERQLKQVIYNLLSNAVKFTPDGGYVKVSVQLVEQFYQPGRRKGDPENFRFIQESKLDDNLYTPKLTKCIQFSVSDTGIGISPKDQQRIFRRFEQADSSTQKKFQGTGLGLSLSKNIVELHGGQIWVESEGAENGSIFHFTIPMSP